MSGARINFGFIPLPQAIVDEGIDLTLNEFRFGISRARSDRC